MALLTFIVDAVVFDFVDVDAFAAAVVVSAVPFAVGVVDVVVVIVVVAVVVS